MWHSQNWIGGEWITPSGEEVSVYNPSDVKQQVGVLHLSTAVDMLQAGQAARHALAGWAGRTGAARGEVLYQLAAVLDRNAEAVASLASSEMGKPISEMRGEVTRGVHILRYYAGEGVRPTGSVIPSLATHVHQYTKRVPLGVVGVITPWNFPVAIPIWKIAPALISGNTVVWKPAEIASLTASHLVTLFAEAGLPAGVLNLVVGRGSVVGDTMLGELDLDGVSFTGSTATGQHVAAISAKRNIKYQTEMGGKNAAIVLRDADLAKTVPTLLSGAFRSAGQKCTATSRVIVERDVYESLADELRKQVGQLRLAPAWDPQAYLGPVASAAQFQQVNAFVQLAYKDTEVLAVGTPDVGTANGHYVAPLVVTGMDVAHPLVQEEIFGPVIAILQADSFEETMDLCNRTVYGLSASLFTRDLTKAMRFLDEAQAGMVRVNQETAGVEYQAPFGGMKWSSSHTREQGQAALDFYSQTKTCAVYYGS